MASLVICFRIYLPRKEEVPTAVFGPRERRDGVEEFRRNFLRAESSRVDWMVHRGDCLSLFVCVCACGRGGSGGANVCVCVCV